MSRLERLKTYARLGLPSLARVGLYRLGLKTGLHPVLRLRAGVADGPFFAPSRRSGPLPEANSAWDTSIVRFGWHKEPLPASKPDWFANPFGVAQHSDAARNWWEIPDFGQSDIKGLWELSRLDWAVAWSTKAAHGDADALARLNNWLSDWAHSNPPYKGPNWKCAQEASIRVMHLILAAWVLGQERSPESGLVELVRAHMQRIFSTTSYAIGQQNNHGTSEAAALFVGGSFLQDHDKRASQWERAGRALLEERALHLIEEDGSFSQYSVNYHRVMLDAYSFAEAWRRHVDLPAFNPAVMARLNSASLWLEMMVDPATGDAPNLGANDGARLLQLTGGDYRDYRPSAQLSATLFGDRDAFGDGYWNSALDWLGVERGREKPKLESKTCDLGGYHILRRTRALCVMRYPRFRFRPSQADALHVDLWHAGVNLLRDAGTMSYNGAGAEWFAGTAAHNTVCFDNRDQMVRLSRFLFGQWLQADSVERVNERPDGVSASAGYTDEYGASHRREIVLSDNKFKCTDFVSGRFDDAQLNWRLPLGDWSIEGHVVRSELAAISIHVANHPDLKPILTSAPESRYYQSSEEVPRVSISVPAAAKITTEVLF